MNGYDFGINYAAGLHVLMGLDPYTVPFYRYPLPFAYFMAVFALLPFQVAFVLAGIINVGILIYAFGRGFWRWLLYFPVLHELSAGQNEIFWWFLERNMGRHWRGALFGALITLKPQSALILLPWHLVDWLRHDRRTLVQWLGFTGLLWGLPLLWRPDWIQVWLTGRSSDANWVFSASNTTGLFSLLKISEALLPLLAIAAVIVYIAGQFQPSKDIAKACALLGNPLGLLYTQMTVMGTAPAWLLVPINLAAVAASLALGNFVLCMAVPLAVIAWQVHQRRRQSAPAAAYPTD